MSEAIVNRRNGTDRRTKDRRVEQVTYGTGSPLTVEEIEASNNVPTCETCGIIHVGRECKRSQEQEDNDAYFRRVGAPEY